MRNTLALLSITSLIVLIAAAIQAPLSLNCDVSWLSHATERMLAGGNYVNNFFETNPPLILYLLLPAVLTIHHFSLAFIGAIKSYIFLLSLISLAANVFLLNKIFLPKDQRISQSFFAILAALFFILPMEEFGQREHIAILFIMPYILLAVIRKANTSSMNDLTATLIGVFASLGFCLKPFFIIPFLLIELYVKRWYARPELYPFIITPIIYTFSVILFFPDYFSTVMPYATRLYYLGYGEPFWQVVTAPLVLFCLLTLPLFFINIKYHYLQRILLITTFSFCLAHIAQRMTLYYHLLPAFSFAILSYTLTAYSVFAARQPKLHHFVIFACIGLCIYWLMVHHFSYLWTLIVFEPNLVYGYLAICIFLCFYLSPLKYSLVRSLFGAAFITLNVMWLSYLIQFTNWYACRFPLTLLLFLLGLLLAIKSNRKHRFHHGFYASIFSLLFLLPVHQLYLHYQNALAWDNIFQPVIHYVKQHPQYHSFYMFNDSPGFTFRLVDRVQLQYSSRLPFMWMVAGLAKQSPEHQHLYQKDKDFLLHMVNTDLQQLKPDILLVDVREEKFKWHAKHYDYLDDFSKDATFKNILHNYRYVRTFTFQTPDGQLKSKLAMYERFR